MFLYGFWSLPFWKNPPSLFSSTCVGQLSWAKDHFPMFCMCWMQALYLSNLKVLKIHFMTIKVVRRVKSGLAYQLPRFFRMAACSMTKDTAIKSSASIKTEVQRDLECCQPMVLNKNAERLWVDNDIAYTTDITYVIYFLDMNIIY